MTLEESKRAIKAISKKYNAHAFNAIRNKDGSWKFIDTQTGRQYSQEHMEKTFSRYEVFDTNSKATK